MSLAIVFKGTDGIVMAADSRITMTSSHKVGDVEREVFSTYDNTTKLFGLNHDRKYGSVVAGVVTYGLGAIGLEKPRTVFSYVSEFEKIIFEEHKMGDTFTMSFLAIGLSLFFRDEWQKTGMPTAEKYEGPDIYFRIAGFDKDEPYGKVFGFSIPSSPDPEEEYIGANFGVIPGGQTEFMERLLNGYDPNLPSYLRESGMDEKTSETFSKNHIGKLAIPIPYQFLTLQDSVDFSAFLIKTTMLLQSWSMGIRGVGGAIDIATITKTEGFDYISRKQIVTPTFS